MDFNSAVSIVRSRYSGNTILNGFEYRDKYIFSLVFGRQAAKAAAGSVCVYVDKYSGKTGIFNYLGELFNDTGEFAKAEAGRIWLDVPAPSVS